MNGSGISRAAPEHPRKSGGCDLAEVALADLPMTPLETLGEHVFDFFLRNKREEWQEYRRQVSRYELDRYLPIL